MGHETTMRYALCLQHYTQPQILRQLWMHLYFYDIDSGPLKHIMGNSPGRLLVFGQDTRMK